MTTIQVVARTVRHTLTRLGYASKREDGTLWEISFKSLAYYEPADVALLEVDVHRLPRKVRVTDLADPEVLHELSTALDGLPVKVVNTRGLIYAIRLSPPPPPISLPKQADFPGLRLGQVGIGVGKQGPVWATWRELGHVLAAGMTGSGKSTFLRLLAYQAVGDGCKLMLADLDGATFPMFAHHPALAADIAGTAYQAGDLVGLALIECDNRAALYRQVPGFPETLEQYNQVASEPLPRLLVILDEFSATVTTNGGPRSQFARDVAELGYRGRKFGVTLVMGAQDFSKEIIGRVRDQVGSALCFRVRSAALSQLLVGHPGGNSLPSGRALTDRWGMVQAYWLDKTRVVNDVTQATDAGALSEAERELVRYALGHLDGCFIVNKLAGVVDGWTSYKVAKLAQAWERRGWLTRPAHATDARRVTPELERLAT
jgi:hypothetical protein